MFSRIAALYLVAVLFFTWGFVTPVLKVFPYSFIASMFDDLASFVAGGESDQTSLKQKILNDLNISPERTLRSYEVPHDRTYVSLPVERLNDRRDVPRVYFSPDAPDIYRALIGAFDFEEAFWGVLLIDPNGRVVHSWRLNGEIERYSLEPDLRKLLYGIAFLPDGSVIFTLQDRLRALVRVGLCGELDWIKPGRFHHSVEANDDRSAVWTLGGGEGELHPRLVLVDAESGKTLREIDMADVQDANPDLHIFDIRWGKNRHPNANATHPNHVMPLPADMADAFPRFAPGDLLLSYRTTNLVFVLDPETLKVNWWYMGGTDGQHDPDWRPDGTISVYSNNHRRDQNSSTIVSIDPNANTHRVILDGADYDFYSAVNGHHDYTDKGTMLVTSSTQGRVFEVNLETGETVFEFVNAYDWEDGETLHMSEAIDIPPEMANRWLSVDCSAPAG